MRVNEPLTDADHTEAKLKFEQAVRREASELLELASKVVDGAPLNEMERVLISGYLRQVSKLKRTAEYKRPRGRQKKIPDVLVLHFHRRRAAGEGYNALINEYAEMFQVDATAIEKAIQKQEKDPFVQRLIQERKEPE